MAEDAEARDLGGLVRRRVLERVEERGEPVRRPSPRQGGPGALQLGQRSLIPGRRGAPSADGLGGVGPRPVRERGIVGLGVGHGG